MAAASGRHVQLIVNMARTKANPGRGVNPKTPEASKPGKYTSLDNIECQYAYDNRTDLKQENVF